jgi:site-specific DNA-methyltransferase (adenine-specific)
MRRKIKKNKSTGEILEGDCLDIMAIMPDESIDSIVTDPPYGLEFMGKKWDKLQTKQWKGGREKWQDNHPKNHIANRLSKGPRYHAGKEMQDWHYEWAREALRVAKPGSHLLAFGGTRTFHRLTVAIEDAGWEIRDCLMWLYGSGFKKGLDISKAIDNLKGETREVIGRDKRGSRDNASVFDDKNCGYEIEFDITKPKSKEAIQWDGWHTGLTPSWEPVILARKPIETTIAKNVLEYRTAGLNIDGCRIETDDNLNRPYGGDNKVYGNYKMKRGTITGSDKGRWPKNVILDEESAAMVDEQSGVLTTNPAYGTSHNGSIWGKGKNHKVVIKGSTGGASRFFKIVEQDRFYYSGKSSRTERETGMGSLKEDQDKRGNSHPTVKPLDLMRYLVRLVTPPNGTVLDPFAGSGTTIIAAMKEGFKGIGIEKESQYVRICNRRINSMAADIQLDRLKV